MKRLLSIICVVLLIALNTGCSPNEPEVLPDISEETINGSVSVISKYGEIKDPEITVEEGKITFYLTPANEEVTNERLRELSILFMKALSGYTVNEGLEGPTEETYGEIYDYYDIEIVIDKEEGEVLDKGTKAKGENEIKWQ